MLLSSLARFVDLDQIATIWLAIGSADHLGMDSIAASAFRHRARIDRAVYCGIPFARRLNPQGRNAPQVTQLEWGN